MINAHLFCDLRKVNLRFQQAQSSEKHRSRYISTMHVLKLLHQGSYFCAKIYATSSHAHVILFMKLPHEASHFLVLIGVIVLFLHFVSVYTHLRSTNINTQCVTTSLIMFTVIIDFFFTINIIPKASRPAVETHTFLFIGCWGSCTRG